MLVKNKNVEYSNGKETFYLVYCTLSPLPFAQSIFLLKLSSAGWVERQEQRRLDLMKTNILFFSRGSITARNIMKERLKIIKNIGFL